MFGHIVLILVKNCKNINITKNCELRKVARFALKQCTNFMNVDTVKKCTQYGREGRLVMNCAGFCTCSVYKINVKFHIHIVKQSTLSWYISLLNISSGIILYHIVSRSFRGVLVQLNTDYWKKEKCSGINNFVCGESHSIGIWSVEFENLFLTNFDKKKTDYKFGTTNFPKSSQDKKCIHNFLRKWTAQKIARTIYYDWQWPFWILFFHHWYVIAI